MRRREFITLIGGAAAAWPLTAGAQQLKVWRIGFLSPADGPGPNHEAFRQQLKKLGYEEGANIQIEWKWVRQRYDYLSQAAIELLQQNIDILVAQTQAAALAAQKATKTIPIVFVGVRDPVEGGLVTSMNRPGGNVTGVTLTPNAELAAKLVELLRDLIPGATRLAIFWNPDVAVQAQVVKTIKTSAQPLGVSILPFDVHRPGDIERAFDIMGKEQCDGLLTLVESFTLQQRSLIARLAIANRLPTLFEVKDYVEAGGLLSYGLPYRDHYAQAANYVVKIIRGAAPRDLPVEQPTKFELVINLKTAKALGLIIPPTLLARADEVIE